MHLQEMNPCLFVEWLKYFLPALGVVLGAKAVCLGELIFTFFFPPYLHIIKDLLAVCVSNYKSAASLLIKISRTWHWGGGVLLLCSNSVMAVLH